MTDQPTALRLADALDAVNTNNADSLLVQMAARSAAAELRRQHAENVDYGATIDHLTRENAEQIGEIVALKEQRDELLAVLEEAEYALDYASDMTKPEGLSGCDCPICTASIRIGEVLAGKRRQA